MVYTQARLEHALRVFREPQSRNGRRSTRLYRQHCRTTKQRYLGSFSVHHHSTWRGGDSEDSDNDWDQGDTKRRRKMETKKECSKKRKRNPTYVSDRGSNIKRAEVTDSNTNTVDVKAAFTTIKLDSNKARGILRIIIRAHKAYYETSQEVQKIRSHAFNVHEEDEEQVVNVFTEPSVIGTVETRRLRSGRVLDRPLVRKLDNQDQLPPTTSIYARSPSPRRTSSYGGSNSPLHQSIERGGIVGVSSQATPSTVSLPSPISLDQHSPLHQCSQSCDGFSIDDEASTRMCTACRTKRARVIRCHWPTYRATTKTKDERFLTAEFKRIPESRNSVTAKRVCPSDLLANESDRSLCNLCLRSACWQCCQKQLYEQDEHVPLELQLMEPRLLSGKLVEVVSSGHTPPIETFYTHSNDERASSSYADTPMQPDTSPVRAVLANSITPSTKSVFDFDLKLTGNRLEEPDTTIIIDDSDEDLIEITAADFYSGKTNPNYQDDKIPYEAPSVKASQHGFIHPITYEVLPFTASGIPLPNHYTLGCGLCVCDPCRILLEKQN